MPPNTYTIETAAEWNAANSATDTFGAGAAPATAYTIDISASFTLNARVDAINLDTGSSLTIVDNGDTINGANTYNGLFAYAGAVAIQNMTIAGAEALGETGGPALIAGGVTANGQAFHPGRAGSAQAQAAMPAVTPAFDQVSSATSATLSATACSSRAIRPLLSIRPAAPRSPSRAPSPTRTARIKAAGVGALDVDRQGAVVHSAGNTSAGPTGLSGGTLDLTNI